MTECDEKSLHSTKTIGSWGYAPNTFIVIQIRLQRSKSGLATVPIVKTWLARILSMAVQSLSCRGANLGEVEGANATIYFFDSNDGQPTWSESVSRMDI